MGLRAGIAGAVALAMGAAPMGAAAREPLVLAPNSPWHVDYAPDSCVLARQFGTGDDAILLRMESFHPGEAYSAGYEITLIGRAFRSVGLMKAIRIGWGNNPLYKRDAVLGTSSNKQPALTFSSRIGEPIREKDDLWDLLTPARASAMSEVRIEISGKEIVLKTGPLAKTLGAMQTCMDELLTQWGIDPAQQRLVKNYPTPLGSPGSWIRSQDYPAAMLARGASAIVHFRLTVDPDGRASNCVIQRATQGAEFIKTTCDLLRKRARFEPALDGSGRPVKSYYTNNVRWVIGP